MDQRLKDIADNLDKITIGADEDFCFHCNMCGKCCINRDDILLNPKDIYNMAKELRIRTGEMVSKYCETYVGDASRIPIVRISPRGSVKRCPLLKDRKCIVHNAKPTVCAIFPIGRCIKLDVNKDLDKLGYEDIQYIYISPDCGDDSETHTVHEWLDSFGIPLRDEFFIKWHRLVAELGNIFRKTENIIDNHLMEKIWGFTFMKLYLEYDTELEFMPQFERNSKKLLDFLHVISGISGKER